VKEMAKAVAMANWLVDLGVPINMSWYSTTPVNDKKFDDYMLSLSKRPKFRISETENGQKFVDQVHSLNKNESIEIPFQKVEGKPGLLIYLEVWI